jgi:hypothetical protein
VDPDPDPVFQVNPDMDPDTVPIQFQEFDDQKWNKNTAEIVYIFLLIKNCNLLIP